MTWWEVPPGPFRPTHGFELSCSMLKTWPVRAEAMLGSQGPGRGWSDLSPPCSSPLLELRGLLGMQPPSLSPLPRPSGPSPTQHSQPAHPFCPDSWEQRLPVSHRPPPTQAVRGRFPAATSFDRQTEGLSAPSAEVGDSRGPRPGRRKPPCPRLHLASSRLPRLSPDPRLVHPPHPVREQQ